MRGADASGFTLDPRLLSSPRFAALGACDLGGLIGLWAAAWSGGGTLPSDEATLAALSRLGPRWAQSQLRASLASFFVAAGDGVLAAVDLAPQLERREAIRAKRSLAGKASAAARSTGVQHVFNTCSTSVQPREEALPSPQEKVTTAPRRAARKSKASVQLAQTGGEVEREAAVAKDCTAPPEKMPPKVRCAVDPCINTENTKNSSDEGGNGKVEKDLWGGLIPSPEEKAPSGRARAAAGDPTTRSKADELVSIYTTKAGSAYPRTSAADRNAAHWLTKGFSFAQLVAAIDNYTLWADSIGKEPKHRKAPANFFGVGGQDDGYFRSFIEPRPEQRPDFRPAGIAKGRDVGSGARVRDYRNDYEACVIHIDGSVPFESPPAAGTGTPPDGGAAAGPNPFLSP